MVSHLISAIRTLINTLFHNWTGNHRFNFHGYWDILLFSHDCNIQRCFGHDLSSLFRDTVLKLYSSCEWSDNGVNYFYSTMEDRFEEYFFAFRKGINQGGGQALSRLGAVACERVLGYQGAEAVAYPSLHWGDIKKMYDVMAKKIKN